MADPTHDPEPVNPEAPDECATDGDVDRLVVPVKWFLLMQTLRRVEARVAGVLAALAPASGEPFEVHVDGVRREFRTAYRSSISATAVDAALGVLQALGFVACERRDAGAYSIRVLFAEHRPGQDQALTQTGNRRVGNRGGTRGGKGKGTSPSQSVLFERAKNTRDEKQRRVWQVCEKSVDVWAGRTGRSTTRVRVTPQRLRMIEQRLAEGYTPDDIYRAIAGLCYSPWHRENAQTAIELAIRSADRIEKCHDLWLRHAPPEKVAAFERATGEVVDFRQDEIEDEQRAERQRAEDERVAREVEEKRAQLEAERAKQEAEDQEWAGFLEDVTGASTGTEG